MTTWLLIIFAYAGPMSDRDSNSLTTAIFATEQHCTAAGEAAKKMAAVTTKVIKYSCTQSGLDGRGLVKEGK
jgi:hypothetical protein